MKKQEHLPQLVEEHKVALALLGARPEFKALEKLINIEERNIMVQSFKVNSGDPAIAIKKAHMEGRVYELRKILKTFEEVKKGKE